MASEPKFNGSAGNIALMKQMFAAGHLLLEASVDEQRLALQVVRKAYPALVSAVLGNTKNCHDYAFGRSREGQQD